MHKLPQPNIDKLRDAAARKKIIDTKKTNHQTPLNITHHEEYWTPSTIVLPSSSTTTTTTTTITTPTQFEKLKRNKRRNKSDVERYENEKSPIRWGFPMITSLFGMAIVRLHEVRSTIELKEHLGGSLALEIVNSSWLQYVLAAAIWYIIGIAVIDFVAIIGNRNR